MRKRVFALALIAMIYSCGAAAAPPPSQSEAAAQEVMDTEVAFDAYTHDHGFAKGFFAYSTTDAINFRPEPYRIHEALGEQLKTDDKDQVSTLRWRPFYIGAAHSGDLAFDLGPWTVEGTAEAGWFFTIWQKQADGRWLWTVDGRAGTATPLTVPPATQQVVLVPAPLTDQTTMSNGLDQDDALNARLATGAAGAVYSGLNDAALGSSGVEPYIPGKGLDQKAADATFDAVMLARPAPGLFWSRDGGGTSSDGGMVYCYGRATAKDGGFAGNYVRVWIRTAQPVGGWRLAADIYQAARP